MLRVSCNGWCFWEHLFGALVAVQVEVSGQEGAYLERPFPNGIYRRAVDLLKEERWDEAEALTAPTL